MSTLLDVKGLTVEFPTSGGTVRAVEDFDLSLNTGETLALVGESGSGKSTAALALLGLIPEAAGRITSGEILFEARDLRRLSPRELRKVRGS